MASKRYQDESEWAQKIRNEWNALAKKGKKDLIGLVRQQYRIIDTSDCDKQSLVYMILRAQYGETRIAAAYVEAK